MISSFQSPTSPGRLSMTRVSGFTALVAAIVLAFRDPTAHVIVGELLLFAGGCFGLRDRKAAS